MLMSLPKFQYLNCATIEEACALLSMHKGKAKVLSGGTDLLVKMKHKIITPNYLINIKRIPGLKGIERCEGKGLNIGTLTTIQAVKNSSLIRKMTPGLHDAASVLGTRQVRNLATIGGNLCNASPAAECAPALLTLDAKMRIAGKKGRRTVNLTDFFSSPGNTTLAGDEILEAIHIPEPPIQSGGIYLKHSTRRIDVAMVGVSVLITMGGNRFEDVRIALGSVGPIPFRAKEAEAALKGKETGESLHFEAARIASDESFPIDDIRGKGDYRKKMVETLVKQAIEGSIARAK
jgi:carbon-monoxide dehydrogenase medium subunit